MAGERDPGPIILFDGVCNLCQASVRFILAHDRDAVFRFAALDSDVGRGLTADGLLEDRSVDSVILVEGGAPYVRSEAILRIAARLGLPWRGLAGLRILPLRLRDGAYDLLARNRYRWFGRREICPAPDGDFRDRFLT
jgi:predicted DCC family thiol-disulfide oxidoreductase YuxK